MLQSVKEKGFHFTDCLYCDAIVDQYVVLRASSEFFLADDGSYSGAVEQIIQELAEEEKRRELWEKLQLSEIRETLTEEHQVEEYFYCHKDGDRVFAWPDHTFYCLTLLKMEICIIFLLGLMFIRQGQIDRK